MGFAKSIAEGAVAERSVLASVTDQMTPGASPLSVKFTAYGTGRSEYVIAMLTGPSTTVAFPEAGVTLYPEIGPTEKAYVPFVALKLTVPGARFDPIRPPKVTPQETPVASPVSVKLTLND